MLMALVLLKRLSNATEHKPDALFFVLMMVDDGDDEGWTREVTAGCNCRVTLGG
jgi:hypothetical protein